MKLQNYRGYFFVNNNNVSPPNEFVAINPVHPLLVLKHIFVCENYDSIQNAMTLSCQL